MPATGVEDEVGAELVAVPLELAGEDCEVGAEVDAGAVLLGAAEPGLEK